MVFYFLWGRRQTERERENKRDYFPEGEQTCCVYCHNNAVFAFIRCSADFTQVWRVRRWDKLTEMQDFCQQALVKKQWLRCSHTENSREIKRYQIKPFSSVYTFNLGKFQHQRDFPAYLWLTRQVSWARWREAGLILNTALLLHRLIHYSPDLKNRLQTNCTAVIKQQGVDTNYSWLCKEKAAEREENNNKRHQWGSWQAEHVQGEQASSG